MNPFVHYALPGVIIVSGLGALAMCLLVLWYGFEPVAETSEDVNLERSRLLVTRLVPAAAAACFTITAALGVVALVGQSRPGRLAAVTPGGLDEIRGRVDVLSRRLGAVESTSAGLEGRTAAVEQRAGRAEDRAAVAESALAALRTDLEQARVQLDRAAAATSRPRASTPRRRAGGVAGRAEDPVAVSETAPGGKRAPFTAAPGRAAQVPSAPTTTVPESPSLQAAMPATPAPAATEPPAPPPIATTMPPTPEAPPAAARPAPADRAVRQKAPAATVSSGTSVSSDTVEHHSPAQPSPAPVDLGAKFRSDWETIKREAQAGGRQIRDGFESLSRNFQRLIGE